MDRGLDFFQDWASARNRIEGIPVYTPHEVTATRYLGVRVDPNDPFFVPVNAHPPTSVLLAMPLAGLDYGDAFLAWAALSLAAFAVSLWMVGRELGVPLSFRSAVAIVTLLLICFPFRLHIEQGQFAIVLLVLITGAWVAYRRSRPVLAGSLLAVAIAVKLFPAYLLLFFLLRRQWRVLAGAAGCSILVAALTAAALGSDIYAVYLREILPGVGDFRSGWGNVSLPGRFKLFDPVTDRMRGSNRSGEASALGACRCPRLSRRRDRHPRVAITLRGANAGGRGPGVRTDRDRDAPRVAADVGALLAPAADPARDHLARPARARRALTGKHLLFTALVVVLWADSNRTD